MKQLKKDFEPSQEYELAVNTFLQNLYTLGLSKEQREELSLSTSELLGMTYFEGYTNGVENTIDTLEELQKNNISVNFKKEEFDA